MQNLKFQKSTPNPEIEVEEVDENGYEGDVESDGEDSEILVEYPDEDEDHAHHTVQMGLDMIELIQVYTR